MASTINAKNTSTGVVITPDSSGQLELQTADTTRMTIDVNGNVGVGTSSPAQQLSVGTSLNLHSGAVNTNVTVNPVIRATTNLILNAGSGANTYVNFDRGDGFIVHAGGSERMRINSSGNVLVGTTSTLTTNQHNFQSSSTTSAAVMTLRNAGATAGLYWQVGPDSNSSFKVYNASNTGMFMSNGSTSWSSSSDETLKTDLKPIENGIDKVNLLRSVTGRFKTDEETVSRSFLIAQDVQAVLPEAVSETPDGYLGVAYTDVIPLLVASIKELKAIIDAQAERIAVLENKQ